MDLSRKMRMPLVLAALVWVAGCADLHTVGRTTRVPIGKDGGLAVHLDAQQRLVIFAANRYCAEPSPDALAAYASALGLSGSKLPTETFGASMANNSVAGSIGLRTQSITLMRDTLYRICEARQNDTLSDVQVAVLLARSQDLTAVILAIEQLTGAVAATPVILSAGGSSSALGSLSANTQAVAAAKQAEQSAKEASAAADAAQKAAQNELDTANGQLTQALAALKANPDDPNLQASVEKQQSAVAAKQTGLAQLTQAATLKAEAYKNMQDTAKLIEQGADAASAVTTAMVTSGGQIGSFGGGRMSDSAAKDVSSTVQTLVGKLLDKRYFEDTCLAVMTSPGAVEAVLQAQTDSDKAAKKFEGKELSEDQKIEFKQSVAVAAELTKSRSNLIDTCQKYFAKYEPPATGTMSHGN